MKRKKNTLKISHLNHPTSQLNNFFIVAQNNKKVGTFKKNVTQPFQWYQEQAKWRSLKP